MQAEITKCDSKNKDLAAHKESMKKKLAAAEAASAKAKTDGEAAKKEHEKCQKEAAEAKKKMEEARAKLEEGAKKYNKVIAGAKKNIELVQAQIADLNDLTAFIETQINPADCDDNCQKFKVWDSTKYINGDESMMDDAKKYITTEIEGLHGVLKEIKAVKKRIYQLQDLDADLHKKIMADVFKAHKKLETTIKVAKAELQKTLDELAKVQVESKKSRGRNPSHGSSFLEGHEQPKRYAFESPKGRRKPPSGNGRDQNCRNGTQRSFQGVCRRWKTAGTVLQSRRSSSQGSRSRRQSVGRGQCQRQTRVRSLEGRKRRKQQKTHERKLNSRVGDFRFKS
jgi:predicted transglutaminase-like cysteine proteinase